MKRKNLLIIMILVMSMFYCSNCSAEISLQGTDNIVLKTTFSFSEIGGTISGICQGDRTMCVYSNSSFIIVDIEDQWSIVTKHKIDHPRMHEDAPSIEQVIYKNGSFFLLVFDHSNSKSYIISQYGNKIEYGEAYTKEIRSFALTDDGYFLTGINEAQHPWNCQANADGNILWEACPEGDSFIPVYCINQEDNILIISQSSTEPSLSISILRSDGATLTNSVVYPSAADTNSVYNIFQIDIFNDDIIMCGERISQSECKGFFLRVNCAGSIIAYREYDEFRRIQSLVNKSGQYIMLALTEMDSPSPYDHYIVSEASSSFYPLERKNSPFYSIGLITGVDNTFYIYGRLENSVIEPDAFIAEKK